MFTLLGKSLLKKSESFNISEEIIMKKRPVNKSGLERYVDFNKVLKPKILDSTYAEHLKSALERNERLTENTMSRYGLNNKDIIKTYVKNVYSFSLLVKNINSILIQSDIYLPLEEIKKLKVLYTELENVTRNCQTINEHFLSINLSKSYESWLISDDTGISSRTMFIALRGLSEDASPKFGTDIPYDVADFGRCYRLIERFPHWKNELNKVSDRFPKWIPFIENWDELSNLYEEAISTNTYSPINNRLNELRGRE